MCSIFCFTVSYMGLVFYGACFHNVLCWWSCFHNNICHVGIVSQFVSWVLFFTKCFVGLVFMMGSVGLFIVRWVLFSQWGLWVLFSLLCWSCCFHSGSCFPCYVGLVVFTIGSVGLVITACSIGLHWMCADCILLALSTQF